MFLRVGDIVRHVFDARISGKILEIRHVKSNTMSTGGSFEDKRYALIEVKNSDPKWVLFDDIMKDP